MILSIQQSKKTLSINYIQYAEESFVALNITQFL